MLNLQAECACIINLVEHDMAAEGGRRADPEAQAGRALRRLRLARSWSQGEVAVRMTAYGYDFHQTTIAKIEAAQRPLRVRELADFAALYGVEVQDLVYPPSRSLPEIDREISDVSARLDAARKAADAARAKLKSAHEAAHAAEATHQAALADVAVLEGRLGSLSADKEKVIGWESEIEYSTIEDGDKAAQDAFESTMNSISSVAGGGPTVLRIVLGAHLRRLREASGITLEEAATAIRSSLSRISRLEHGRSAVKDRDIIDLLNLYGVTPMERQQLSELALQANRPGWWHDYSDILPNWFEPYIGLEMAATDLWVYGALTVPDLLQTEDYSRAVTSQSYGDASTREIERRVRLRTTRQAKLLDRSNPLNLRVVLDEAVLRRQVGGPEIMRDQLKYLADIAEQPNITVQVLPLDTTGSAAGSFNILLFAESSLTDIVYMEQLMSALYLDRSEEVDTYRRLMDDLSAQALTPHHTTMFLRELIATSAN